MPYTGGLSPLPRESCSPESEACFCSPFFSPRSTSAATRSSRTFHLVRDVMAAARIPRPSWMAPSSRDSPSCRIPTTRAAITSLCASQKQTSQSEGFPTRTHVLCLSVTYAVRSANRTHCAGHVELSHMRPPGEPVHSESVSQPSFCPSAG